MKIQAQSSDPKLKWHRPRLLLPHRFGSQKKATAQLRTWSTRKERPLGRSQRPRLTEKTDLILCTEPPKGGLPESDALIVKGQFMFVPTMPLMEPSCSAMAS